jgi:predicted ATPase
MATKIERGIAALPGDLGWTAPFVRQMLGVGAVDPSVASLDSASRRSETFRAFKAIVRAAATQQPLVLVAEDLHWIDAASEEYLAFIADTIPMTRALLVCSHRPGLPASVRRPQLPRPHRAPAAVRL